MKIKKLKIITEEELPEALGEYAIEYENVKIDKKYVNFKELNGGKIKDDDKIIGKNVGFELETYTIKRSTDDTLIDIIALPLYDGDIVNSKFYIIKERIDEMFKLLGYDIEVVKYSKFKI